MLIFRCFIFFQVRVKFTFFIQGDMNENDEELEICYITMMMMMMKMRKDEKESEIWNFLEWVQVEEKLPQRLYFVYTPRAPFSSSSIKIAAVYFATEKNLLLMLLGKNQERLNIININSIEEQQNQQNIANNVNVLWLVIVLFFHQFCALSSLLSPCCIN